MCPPCRRHRSNPLGEKTSTWRALQASLRGQEGKNRQERTCPRLQAGPQSPQSSSRPGRKTPKDPPGKRVEGRSCCSLHTNVLQEGGRPVEVTKGHCSSRLGGKPIAREVVKRPRYLAGASGSTPLKQASMRGRPWEREGRGEAPDSSISAKGGRLWDPVSPAAIGEATDGGSRGSGGKDRERSCPACRNGRARPTST